MVEAALGCSFRLEDIERAMEKNRPVVLFVTQGESSSGVLQPIEGLGPLCQR